MDNMADKARPHFLSVRLSNRELKLYAAMLKWYGLEFFDKTTSASHRFRELLEKFSEGLQVVDVPEAMLKHLIRRPPDWPKDQAGISRCISSQQEL